MNGCAARERKTGQGGELRERMKRLGIVGHVANYRRDRQWYVEDRPRTALLYAFIPDFVGRFITIN